MDLVWSKCWSIVKFYICSISFVLSYKIKPLKPQEMSQKRTRQGCTSLPYSQTWQLRAAYSPLGSLCHCVLLGIKKPHWEKSLNPFQHFALLPSITRFHQIEEFKCTILFSSTECFLEGCHQRQQERNHNKQHKSIFIENWSINT